MKPYDTVGYYQPVLVLFVLTINLEIKHFQTEIKHFQTIKLGHYKSVNFLKLLDSFLFVIHQQTVNCFIEICITSY